MLGNDMKVWNGTILTVDAEDRVVRYLVEDKGKILYVGNGAVNHSVSEQSLTIKEALRMCTYNGAYATFDEKERGSLEVGKIADFAILSDNLYEIEPAKIS